MNEPVELIDLRLYRQATPALTSVVLDAHWNGAPLAVDGHAFSAVLSDEGVCYTFNILSAATIFSANAA